MAEFQEVMRQLNRLCSHYQNYGENGCPMFDECGNIGAYCSQPKQSYRIEKTIMAWAAENPEPVYPTWGEYIRSITGLDTVEVNGMRLALTRTIPADIAQKLGIEPKEE